jgi:hypothetical protein
MINGGKNMNSLEIRIQKLERKNRILSYFVIMFGLIFCAVFFLGASSSRKVSDEIVTHSLKIINDQGKNSAQIVATPDGFVGLYFRDLKDELRFGVTMTPSGKASIDFFRNSRVRLQVGVVDGKNGEEYSIQLKDRDGKPIWQSPITNLYN